MKNRKIKAAPSYQENAASKKSQHAKNKDSSAQAQRSRLLDWLLKKNSITTIEARRDLDVMMPAARVHELRHRLGYRIETFWVWQETDAKHSHRVARYVLMPRGAK